MRKLVVSLTAVIAFASLAGCSSSSQEDLASSRQAIQGGTTDTSHSFAVGIFTGTGLCSGALIAPNLVLTARHCVAQVSAEAVDCTTDKFGKNYPASNFYITTKAQMPQSETGYHQASKVVTPTETKFCGNDIALIVLADNVPASEAKPITPAVEFPITDRSHYSDQVTAIGYGITAVGAQDEGVRRIRQNISIYCIPGDKTMPCGNIPGIEDTEFVTDPGTCSGDSGSSAYDEKSFDDGSPISLGVLSRGGEQGTKCLEAVYTRADSFKELIIQTAYEAAQTGGYPPPAWTNPPPQDDGTPQQGALGASCDSGDACLSKLCESPSDDASAAVCTQACTPGDDATCPEGYKCADAGDGNGFCFEGASAPAPNAADGNVTRTTTTGCSVSGLGGPTNPVPWIFGVALGAAAITSRRRRRR